ncbi:PREDICTED: sodium- and chloride-dependent betaine transporter-like, partial [Propithecus coquereli]|uniref:sodium- and chloride-dependent betaine transporter-like n=1 Tax=Propithecus coquereli TaxID=379532 RepID=UPI00063F005C
GAHAATEPCGGSRLSLGVRTAGVFVARQDGRDCTNSSLGRHLPPHTPRSGAGVPGTPRSRACSGSPHGAGGGGEEHRAGGAVTGARGAVPALGSHAVSRRAWPGADRFYDNIEDMIGYRPWPLVKISWLFLTPGLCLATFLFSLSKYAPLKYNNVYVYPPWGYCIGWFLALSSMVCVPLFVVITLLKTQGSFKKRLRQLTTPDSSLPQPRPHLCPPGGAAQDGRRPPTKEGLMAGQKETHL